MKLISKSFRDKGKLPDKYSRDGKNILPKFIWTNVPDKTKSFVFYCFDSNAPQNPFIHLFLYNIPSNIRKITDTSIPSKAKFLENGFGSEGYDGPQPPVGEKHTYNFVLVALNTKIKPDSLSNIMKKVKVHTLGQASVSCTYKKYKSLVAKKADVSGDIPLEQQKSILRYAPKDKLWFILDTENAWEDTLIALPEPYRQDFARITDRLSGSASSVLAKTYIRQKVKLQHLRDTIISNWNPQNITEASIWLRKNGFLRRPLMPINLRANSK